MPAPRAVYVGTIDERLDAEGVAELARARPGVTIVLLGHVAAPAHLAPVEGIPNVIVHPAVGRAELVAVLRDAEAALVAHRVTPLTEAMSPLKAYEYLAAGAPVLSVDLPPMHGIDPRVRLVPRVRDFGDAIDEVIAAGRADEEERMRFVARNSWESRHRDVFELLFARSNVSG
ncbi:glycosyltransferase [Protaetiibacter intestinalis]|uniref:Glycosyltransferase n=1 Tax=Protaetiibacter intestinalis TaxID=2419774 RepID=A0A387B967_9MICO|nr:glycosyltransferase [Protaetiibacter intestinalis]